MRLPAWAPVTGGSVERAAAATPARLATLRVVRPEDIFETVEQPTEDLFAQVAAVGLAPSTVRSAGRCAPVPDVRNSPK